MLGWEYLKSLDMAQKVQIVNAVLGGASPGGLTWISYFAVAQVREHRRQKKLEMGLERSF